MVITRAYASLLTDVGIAHYGRRVKDQHHRVFLEVIRGERIDYVSPFDFDEHPKDPPCWHPPGLPDRLEKWPSEKRGPPARREKPMHDVVTEHAEGYKRWRRPKKPPATPPKAAAPARQCPNCGEMTNSGIHCAGIKTVRVAPPRRPKKPPPAKRVELSSVPRTHHRLCTVCKSPTNELAHCGEPTKEREPYRYRRYVPKPYKPPALRRRCECGDLTNELAHCEGKRTFAR